MATLDKSSIREFFATVLSGAKCKTDNKHLFKRRTAIIAKNLDLRANSEKWIDLAKKSLKCYGKIVCKYAILYADLMPFIMIL